ncbi:7318_t:CDS:2 [Acaulospora colombiana]|uniref:7318_t:CDS:1 n=1 Tax=Acaulospora colombiana TaxID=27376 RepID=A0ACA9LNY9_9GLOM|nr:7318_t:CDS:2 [Acaulospora colombiana]
MIDEEWCQPCEKQFFQSNFPNWTSGNKHVDDFLRGTQLLATTKFNFLEWIPYDKLIDIEHIGSGGFGEVFSATWIDGPRTKWDAVKLTWERYPNVKVALKSIVKLREENVTADLFQELRHHLEAINKVLGRVNTLRTFGMSYNPESKTYIMVMILADEGDLGNYLKSHFSSLTYLRRLDILHDIAIGIAKEFERGEEYRLKEPQPQILHQNYNQYSVNYSVVSANPVKYWRLFLKQKSLKMDKNEKGELKVKDEIDTREVFPTLQDWNDLRVVSDNIPVGAVVADKYLGRYSTIVIFSLVYMIGLIVLTLTAIPPAIEAKFSLPGLLVAMVIIGLGTGGIKPNVSPMSADQYTKTKAFIRTLSSGERAPDALESTLTAIYLTTVGFGNVLGFGVVPFSKDPYLVILYLSLGVVAFVAGCLMYWLFSHFDVEGGRSKEDENVI